MKRGLSLWLDVLRVTATLIVVLSHWAYPRFTGGDYLILRQLNLGSDAVIVFFVLSGFVIAYAADRDKQLHIYAFNRLTRLWSVMIPAIVLTFTFDQIGLRLNPAAYPQPYYSPTPLWEMLVRGLSFSNEWVALDRVRLGSNGPLWSLSYEAGFYAMFGVAMFLRGPMRVGLLVLVVLLVGPRILLLMPAWLMGVRLWSWVKRGGHVTLGKPAAWALCLAGPALYVLGLSIDLPGALTDLTAQAMAPVNYRQALAFSDEFIWNAFIGVFTVLHLMGAAALMGDTVRDRRWVRWLAGASFSVYVTHYPALQLLDAALPDAIPARHVLLLGGTIFVGLVFAEVFERRLALLRRLCSRWIRTSPGPQPVR